MTADADQSGPGFCRTLPSKLANKTLQKAPQAAKTGFWTSSHCVRLHGAEARMSSAASDSFAAWFTGRSTSTWGEGGARSSTDSTLDKHWCCVAGSVRVYASNSSGPSGKMCGGKRSSPMLLLLRPLRSFLRSIWSSRFSFISAYCLSVRCRGTGSDKNASCTHSTQGPMDDNQPLGVPVCAGQTRPVLPKRAAAVLLRRHCCSLEALAFLGCRVAPSHGHWSSPRIHQLAASRF